MLSLQLVVLAVWKRTMSVCHRALAVMEGSPSRGRRMRLRPGGHNSSSSLPLMDSEFVDATRNHINKDFLVEVTQTEELTSCIGYIYASVLSLHF